ncbi:437L [Invertebrate iridescent virus Kaz2018]|uniref:Uncharacterized protein 437L n=1 Tax=Invertebrate iridescent virus 6 TaxID=176652 RepID=437L_IIV6|nr:437L [Invertebrate iridescent virus 6]Q91F88.1 RecName: Full=Uncharacterized protein 437L [Invertebrate iridescent virus 6]AAK82297.1 437L [Invertebrate iridescent virus 6]QMS79428.1 hypothetical protein IIV6-T1_429 [Invertebrate iridescent virus 6]QNH08847.1 437L [Invertebrate iridescent virus Kaz2018]
MDNLYSQINSEININVLKLCRLISKNFNNGPEPKELYKLWIDALPKEVTEDFVIEESKPETNLDD